MNEKNVLPLQPKSENVFTKEEQMKAFNSTSRKVVARQKCRANASRGGGITASSQRASSQAVCAHKAFSFSAHLIYKAV